MYTLRLVAAIMLGSLAGLAVADAMPAAAREEPFLWWHHEMQYRGKYMPPDERLDCTRDGRPQLGRRHPVHFE